MALSALVLLGSASCTKPKDEPAPSLSPKPDAAPAEAGASATSSLIPHAPPAIADDVLLRRIKKAIARHRMTTVSPRRLSFELGDDEDASFRTVDVREKHVRGGSGDPSTAPRLFSFRLERGTGRLYSDALSDVGEFLPVSE